MTEQSQKAGDNSTNVQAGTIIVNQGLSVLEVRELALDVFRANFIQLSGTAQDIARQRAEEITERFLQQLTKDNPNGLTQAQSPDFQYALFTVQREYARSGDAELADLLVDLLVDRTKENARSILQIVLNESLAVAPKLTEDQLAALSVIFVFRYTLHRGITDLESLAKTLDACILPFADQLLNKPSTFRHLEYCGCGTHGITSVSLIEVFRRTYGGVFSIGFDQKQLELKQLGTTPPDELFTECLNDSNKRQLAFINEEELRSACERLGVDKQDVEGLVALFNETLMDHEAIKQALVRARGYMERVFDMWGIAQMGNFALTSVGMAIGHANVKKTVGEFANLGIWIN